MTIKRFQNWQSVSLNREHRLCHFESPENAAEVTAVNRANLAPNATKLIEEYSKKEVASRFPFIKDPFHREMFFAFAMERDGFKDVRENGSAAPAVDVQLLTDYQKIIAMLNDALSAKRISFRDFPEKESRTTTNKYLRRDEYLAIIARCMQNVGLPRVVPLPPPAAPGAPLAAFPDANPSFTEGQMKDLIDKIVTGDLASTRGTVAALQAREPAYKEKIEKVSKLNNSLSVASLQPNELLNRFNVFLGPRLFEAYINHVRGKIAPGSVNIPNNSAHTWTEHPERAYRFLHGRMMHTSVNDRFLDALNYWFVASDPAVQASIQRRHRGREPLKQDDTEAILDLIIKTLTQHEGVATRSLQQQADLKEQVGPEEKLEKGVADAWEYLKDFREHPVGSAAIAGIGIVAALYLWRLKDKEKFTPFDLTMLGAFGVLGVNAFIKHQTGEGILDHAKELTKKYTGVELFSSSDVPLEQQTLPNYWAKVVDSQDADKDIPNNVLTENRRIACLTLLQDQRLNDVTNWYEKMELWRTNGSRGAPPALPFPIQRAEKFFGNADRREILHYFHQTLHHFFFERGRNLPPNLRTSSLSGGSDYAAKGLAYIRQKYMVSGLENVADNRLARFPDVITYNGKTYDLSKPQSDAMLKLRKDDPQVYRRLLLGRLIEKNFDWRNLKMYTVFLMEADPNGLNALGPLGADTAGLVREIQKEVEAIEAST